MPEKLLLGQLIIFTKQLKREKEGEFGTYSRTWIESEVPHYQSRSGFVMGIRTVCDVKTEVEHDEDGNQYGYHLEHFNYRKVAIVSYSLSRKPALVPLDAITVING